MRGEQAEIVYRVRSRTCLYFEGFSSDLQMPLRVTSTTTVTCGNGVYVVPRIPGRELARLFEDGVEASDMLPPCDWLDALKEEKGIVELGDLLELRYVSFVDRVTGMPVKCYVVVAKPGILFEGVVRVRRPCEEGRLRTVIDRLLEDSIVGGLRLLGCGFIEPVSVAVRLADGSLRVVGSGVEGEKLVCSV